MATKAKVDAPPVRRQDRPMSYRTEAWGHRSL